MPYSLDDIDPDKTFEPFELPHEGFYHVQLINVEPKIKDNGKTYKFVWEIVGSPNDPNMVTAIGKKVNEFLSDWTPLFTKQIVRIGQSCEIYSTEFLKGLKDKGEQLPDPDFDSWLGTSCVVKITHEKRYNDPKKTDAKIGWDYFMVNSPESREAKVLLNRDVLDESSAIVPKNDDMFG
jgi:hypothetical protein